MDTQQQIRRIAGEQLIRKIAAAHWDGETNDDGEILADISNDAAHDWIVEIITSARQIKATD